MSSRVNELERPDLKLGDLLGLLTELEATPEAFPNRVAIGISANVTTEGFETAFKQGAFPTGTLARVVTGNFDSHVENATTFADEGLDYAIFLSFLDQLQPSFEVSLTQGNSAQWSALQEKIAGELKLFLENTKTLKKVFVLSHLPFFAPINGAAQGWLDGFNQQLRMIVSQYVHAEWIETADLVAASGTAAVLNPRYYYQHKAPFTLAFWQSLTREIKARTRNFQTYYYKVLVLDADSTLWGGIIGEDGMEGIKLDPFSYPGNIFWNVQQQLLSLQQAGVLLCLASKNNPAEVDEVLSSHPNRVLTNEHFVMKRVNWEPKAENLERLAKDLNLGLESFVFLDDSAFEIEGIKARLPQVKTFLVPKNLFEYPALMRKVRELFLAGGVSAESAQKSEQYRLLAQAESERKTYSSQDEYLASLELKVEVRKDALADVARVAELTQKSNQFNVTTKRYTEAEIRGRMESPESSVYSITVKDRFGNHGLTGVLITEQRDEELVVDSFLMSCRVIGRGIEYGVWCPLLEDAAKRGAKKVKAQFLKTGKNQLVEHFFDDLGLQPVAQSDKGQSYEADLSALELKRPGHLEVTYGG